MKRLISSILALSVFLSLSSCQNNSAVDSSSASIASQTMYSFKSADINMADDFEEIICTKK